MSHPLPFLYVFACPSQVETVGPVYMVAAGLPVASSDHISRLASLALRIAAAADSFAAVGGEPLRVRMGLHTGRVTGGIIGMQLPQYQVRRSSASVAFHCVEVRSHSALPMAFRAASFRPVLFAAHISLVHRCG